MEPMTKTPQAQLTEARGAVCASRYAYENATTAKARREAAEALEFWTNKSAYLDAMVKAAEAPMFEVVAELEVAVDGFDAWAAEAGELATTFVDGDEVVEPSTIAEFAFAIEVAAAQAAGEGRLFS